jgi:methyl-accepting chemotaxis protein
MCAATSPRDARDARPDDLREAGKEGARVSSGAGSSESLQRAEELLERLRTRVDALEASADSGGDVDEAVDGLAEIAELAKEIEAEVQRARQAADAGA